VFLNPKILPHFTALACILNISGGRRVLLLFIPFLPRPFGAENQHNMIRTGNPVISIYTEMTPNPETLKFVANKLLYPGKSADFPDEGSAAPSPLAKELFSFPFIKSVFIASNFVTLTKTSETDDWQDVIPTVKQFLKEYLENGGVVINEEEFAAQKQQPASNTVAADDNDVVVRIKELLENYVKPAVEMDGGAIQFKSYADGVVNLALQGSCSGCPSSMITLKAGIEGMMKRMIPEVQEVVADAE
jgi:Fe-S cluster biogenesis protein NfuA